ncbi:MAG: TraR/DksA family transcriptional regulator [Thermodesulfobacteria bacterium]|nr:TraR/DksA family transcriptional regulator [Thermodesulfobacteriota bacterium]
MARTRRPLTDEEIQEFKNMLLQKKDEIWQAIRDDLKSRVSEEYYSLINDVNDEEDLAQIDLQEEVILGVLEARKKELEAIDQALWRIEHGEYGRCLECEDWICIERLKVRPWAIYCRDCKERLERLGKV